MRTKIVLLIVFGSFFNGLLRGQNISEQNRWSIAFGYYPVYDFDLSAQLPAESDNFYLFGFSGKVDYRLSDRISILSGFNVRKIQLDWPYDHLIGYENRVSMEIPIQINYYFHQSSNSILPYLKISAKNCYFHRNMTDPVIYERKEYNFLFDIGFGTDLRINDRLFAVCEIGFGYMIKYQYRYRGYLDGFLGLQYKFKNKS